MRLILHNSSLQNCLHKIRAESIERQLAACRRLLIEKEHTLQQIIRRLRTENRRLRTENTQLRTENKQLRVCDTAHNFPFFCPFFCVYTISFCYFASTSVHCPPWWCRRSWDTITTFWTSPLTLTHITARSITLATSAKEECFHYKTLAVNLSLAPSCQCPVRTTLSLKRTWSLFMLSPLTIKISPSFVFNHNFSRRCIRVVRGRGLCGPQTEELGYTDTLG